MTVPQYLVRHVMPVASALLPSNMSNPKAWALLMAIGRQESRFKHRKQLPNGPARGWWQFETGGVRGVLGHGASEEPALDVLQSLGYVSNVAGLHLAVEHNDALAMCFARLLLWTDPRALPGLDDPDKGWAIYLNTWRPGKPHEKTWAECFAAGWADVEQG